MHTHIVHAHPEPASYNGALTRAAGRALRERGGTVTVIDLYRANFDPVERADHYAERISVDSFATLGEQRHAAGTSSSVNGGDWVRCDHHHSRR
jgi:NAD(P)H dehydrogenase (quinone)